MFIAKVLTLLVYVVGIIAAINPVFGAASPYLSYLALAFIVAHSLEVLVSWKYLKLYEGGMAQSIVLCLLFGVGHWIPLKKAAQAQLS